jgi:hypothetical protein
MVRRGHKISRRRRTSETFVMMDPISEFILLAVTVCAVAWFLLWVVKPTLP